MAVSSGVDAAFVELLNQFAAASNMEYFKRAKGVLNQLSVLAGDAALDKGFMWHTDPSTLEQDLESLDIARYECGYMWIMANNC